MWKGKDCDIRKMLELLEDTFHIRIHITPYRESNSIIISSEVRLALDDGTEKELFPTNIDTKIWAEKPWPDLVVSPAEYRKDPDKVELNAMKGVLDAISDGGKFSTNRYWRYEDVARRRSDNDQTIEIPKFTNLSELKIKLELSGISTST